MCAQNREVVVWGCVMIEGKIRNGSWVGEERMGGREGTQQEKEGEAEMGKNR